MIKEIQYKVKPDRFRVCMERPQCRKRILKLMEEQNLTLAQIASRLIGRNMKKQAVRMLYQSGYSPEQIEDIMEKVRKQIKNDIETDIEENNTEDNGYLTGIAG